MITSIVDTDNYLGKAECSAALALRESNPRLAWLMLADIAKYRASRLQECPPEAPFFESWSEAYRAAALPANFLLYCLKSAAPEASQLNRLAQPYIDQSFKLAETIWQIFVGSMSPLIVEPADVPYRAALSHTFFADGVLDLLLAMDRSCIVVGETYKWQLRVARASQIFENTRQQKKFRADCYRSVRSSVRQPYDPNILDNGVDPEIQRRQRYL